MNRLAWATDGIRTTTYGYAGMGRRVAVTGSVVKLYEVDEAGRRLGEYVKDATQLNGWRAVQEFVYLDAWRIVGIADYNASGVFTDMLAVVSDPITGTPRQVIDQDGDVRWDWDAREPFGYQAPNETPTAGKAALVFDARFPGQWSDEVAGTYHNNWREYWPRAGRYTQVDPIGLAGGENPYAYVMGNPVEAVDPEGLSERDVEKIKERATRLLAILNETNLKHQDPAVNNSLWNRQVSPLHGARSFFETNPGYLDCKGQAEYMEKYMTRWFFSEGNGLDAKWRAWSDQATYAGFGHNWSVLTSNNKSDPIIWIDSLHGNISVGTPYSTCKFGRLTGENIQNHKWDRDMKITTLKCLLLSFVSAIGCIYATSESFLILTDDYGKILDYNEIPKSLLDYLSRSFLVLFLFLIFISVLQTYLSGGILQGEKRRRFLLFVAFDLSVFLSLLLFLKLVFSW